MHNWVEQINIGITVSDKDGNILEMNEKSAQIFAKSGGKDLIGKSLKGCHPEPAKSLLLDMLANPRTNVYTIEKGDVKKMIYQTPWFKNGEYMGFVELSLEIPFEIKHFVRKP